MKTDPAPQPEQQHEDLTLLDQYTMKPNSTLHSARKRLRKMRRLFKTTETPHAPVSRSGIQPRQAGPGALTDLAENPVAPSAPGAGVEPVPDRDAPLLIEKMDLPPIAHPAPVAVHGLKPESESTVLLLSDDGRIVDAHPSCSALLGWQPGELIGKGMGEVFDKEVDLLLESLLKSPEADETGEPAQKEPVQVVAVRKDASTFYAELTLRRRAALNAWSVVLRLPTPLGTDTDPRPCVQSPAVSTESEPPPVSVPQACATLQPAASLSREDGTSGPAEPHELQPSEPATRDGNTPAETAELDLMRAQLESACNELQKRLEGTPEATLVADALPAAPAPTKPAEPETPRPVEAQHDVMPAAPVSSTESAPPAPLAAAIAGDDNPVSAPESKEQDPVSSPVALPAEPAPAEPLPRSVLTDAVVLEPATKPQPLADSASALPAERVPVAPAPVSFPVVAEDGFDVEPQLAHQVEIAELERRLRESVASLARVTAEFERERGTRRRSDQRANDLAAQLQALHQEFGLHLEAQKLDQQRMNELREGHSKLQEALSQARETLAQETAERELAEEQLRGADDLSGRLEANLKAVEEAKQSFKDAEAEMEARLAASARAVAESEAKLKQETSERQRLEEALVKIQRELQENSVRSRLEFSKRESTRHVYELERRGCDADELRSRYAAIGNKRESHALLHSLCQQMHPPLAALHRSACQLLQAQLQEPDKQEVRTLLENILLLQMSLQQASGTTRTAAVSERAPESESKPL